MISEWYEIMLEIYYYKILLMISEWYEIMLKIYFYKILWFKDF